MRKLLIILLIVTAGIASARRPSAKAAKSSAPTTKAQAVPSNGLASDAPLPVATPAAVEQKAAKRIVFPSEQSPETTVSSSAVAPATKVTFPSEQMPGAITAPERSKGE